MPYTQTNPGSSPNYRVFFLSVTGRIDKPPVLIEANDDDDAIGQASRLLDGHDLELWDRGRFILRLSAKQSTN